MAAAAAAGRCGRDPCGALCPLLTYLGVGYAVLAHVLPQPALRGSPWCPFHAAAFNLIVLLLLACHARAVLADPGVVPLPDTAIDFSDLRSGAPRKPERSQEDWTVCDRCEAYRPPRAHHCRICHRCVRRMDHHCPWINNCVGELNQKYFIQFLFYAGCVDHHGQDAPGAAPQSGVEGGEPGGATFPETQTGAAAGGVRARFRALLALPLELQHPPRHGSHVQPPAQPLRLSSLHSPRKRMLETH
ncbi:palmitoyltransferase ZDHHC3-like isoform X2 [Aquila chrysaetos chrysaetos]|uniref:palmitoyltransferase ZDHHC3-like isoform X2 n=1 Tax=Aquila chrysaetos chrysaetos TaxID=223781 RepID=UPI0011773131|nr:palmitoyltransferase ZDHHC3-like isoform X2 [Aquila chrysaetos chrysaetos]